MPSGFVRDFANNSSFLGKRDSELSTYQSYTLNVPSGLLESIFLLASFFLPSSYLLPTHYFVFTKRIFSTQFITNSKLSIFKFQVSQNCINICFVEPTLLLPPCYRLAIDLLPSTFPLPCIYLGRSLDVPCRYFVFTKRTIRAIIIPYKSSAITKTIMNC